MNESNNETGPTAAPLRVGLIAGPDEAETHAAAIRACAALELCAQGGMEQKVALPDVEWFDDTRVLIAQGGIEALIIATSPRDAVKLGEIASGHGVHVWRRPPLGRDFAEAVEVARCLAAARVVYRIASWWEHAESEIRWALKCTEGSEPVFSDVRVSAAGPPLASWRSSQAAAGGGVLAHDAYAALEALTALRGLPESVSGAIGKCRRRAAEGPRETEDVASAILRYGNGGLGQVRATWDIAPYDHLTQHHGKGTSIRYSARAVATLNADGGVLDERALPADFLEAELARFAAQVADAERGEPATESSNRHLAVSALLEATYLSSRTRQPEDPHRPFEVQKWPVPKR